MLAALPTNALRPLRAVCRAARGAADARLRSLTLTPPADLRGLPEFVARLPQLSRLEFGCGDEAFAAAQLSTVPRLPPSLQRLGLQLWWAPPASGASVMAPLLAAHAPQLPQLRSLEVRASLPAPALGALAGALQQLTALTHLCLMDAGFARDDEQAALPHMPLLQVG